jgi:hypothetical protein
MNDELWIRVGRYAYSNEEKCGFWVVNGYHCCHWIPSLELILNQFPNKIHFCFICFLYSTEKYKTLVLLAVMDVNFRWDDNIKVDFELQRWNFRDRLEDILLSVTWYIKKFQGNWNWTCWDKCVHIKVTVINIFAE